MQASFPTLRRTPVAGIRHHRSSLTQVLRRWLIAAWASLCAQAERPDRQVPRY